MQGVLQKNVGQNFRVCGMSAVRKHRILHISYFGRIYNHSQGEYNKTKSKLI